MDILNPNKDFQYAPLDNSRRQIRLLSLQEVAPDGENSNLIRCSLESHEILSWGDEPIYSALSYTWGEPNSDRDQYILIDGKKFLVRENLHHFLRTLRQDNRSLFWIDQICINQSDVHEQNHQVQFMSEIYSCAKEVIVWLGPAADDSDQAMDILYTRSGTVRRVLRELKAPLQALFQRPYWKRLWVVQEIMLARSLTLRCGEKEIPWLTLQYFFLTPKALGSKPGAVHDFFGYESDESENQKADNSIAEYGIQWPQAQDGGVLGRQLDRVSAEEAEEIVRARDYGSGGQVGRLSYILTSFSKWHCRNPRDKVYGLLGLVNESKRVEIDYQNSVEDVFVDVVRKVIEDEPFMDHDSQLEFAESLRASLGILDFEFHQLVHLEFEKRASLRGQDISVEDSFTESTSEDNEFIVPESSNPAAVNWSMNYTVWNKESDNEGELPAADGVPMQEDWDPVTQLEQLARRQRNVLSTKLGKSDESSDLRDIYEQSYKDRSVWKEEPVKHLSAEEKIDNYVSSLLRRI